MKASILSVIAIEAAITVGWDGSSGARDMASSAPC